MKMIMKYILALVCLSVLGKTVSAANAFANGAGWGVGLGVANGAVKPTSLIFDTWFTRWLTRSKYEKPDVIVKRLNYLEGLMKKQTERLVRRRQEALAGFGGLVVAIKKFDKELALQEATARVAPKKDSKSTIADLLSDD
jgi:hypothetical protein